MHNEYISTNYGSLFNLLIPLIVVLFGISYLKTKSTDISYLLRRRAYQFWWGSWLMWVLLWTIQLLKPTYFVNETFSEIVTLILDNLNTVFIIMMYMVLTRGQEYANREYKYDLIHILLFFIVSVFVLYGSLTIINQIDLAIILHKTWSLSLGTITPMLLGWAYKLRFKTNRIFLLSLIYGFMQPLLYMVTLPEGYSLPGVEYLLNFKLFIQGFMASMKILLAFYCVKTLMMSQAFVKNLISESDVRKRDHTEPWPKILAFYGISLFVIFIAMASYVIAEYYTLYETLLNQIVSVFGIIGFGLTVYTIFSKMIDNTKKKRL